MFVSRWFWFVGLPFSLASWAFVVWMLNFLGGIVKVKTWFVLLAAVVLGGCATVTLPATPDGPTSGSAEIPLHVFQAREPAPTIVMGHGCDGYNPTYIWRAQVIKSWGYNVVVVDSHSGRGIHDNLPCRNPVIITEDMRAHDLVQAAEWVKTQPWHKGKIGVIGYSAGAAGAEYLAKHDAGPIAAAVEYYPWCTPDAYDPKIPVQIHIGTKDTWTPSTRCDGPTYQEGRDIHIYQGATHAFDIDLPARTGIGKHQIRYDASADASALKLTRSFFAQYLQ